MPQLNNAEHRELTSAWHNLFSSSCWWTTWKHIWKIFLVPQLLSPCFPFFPSLQQWILSPQFPHKNSHFTSIMMDIPHTIILTAPHAVHSTIVTPSNLINHFFCLKPFTATVAMAASGYCWRQQNCCQRKIFSSFFPQSSIKFEHLFQKWASSQWTIYFNNEHSTQLE